MNLSLNWVLAAAALTLSPPLLWQLLKIFQIFFVFSLPFVLAPPLAIWTPVVSVFSTPSGGARTRGGGARTHMRNA